MASNGFRWGLHAQLLFSALLLGLLPTISSGQLSTTYYDYTCPNLETIVSDKLDQILAQNPGMAPGLLRLHFHDCFVRGCDASILLDSTLSNSAEKDALPNNGSVRGFAEIDAIKAEVENACPGVVSCADILTVAARDATEKVGGYWWPVYFGRKDGLESVMAEANASLPSPFMNFTELVKNFAAVGLSANDMVILSGAHTIGQAHCATVLPRLYNFSANASTDPSIDPAFADHLKTLCPSDQPLTFIPMDSSNGTFDNAYFKAVLSDEGIFTSDAALISDSFGLQIVTEAASSSTGFINDFAAAMVRMGNINVLTGYEGQIRLNCSVINI